MPGGPARRRLRDRERALSLRARLQRRELESRAARAADAAGRQCRRRASTCWRSTAVTCGRRERLRAASRTPPRSQRRAEGRPERRTATGAREVTVVPVASESGPALPGVDRRQPPQGGHDERRHAGLRLHARHGRRRLHELQPLLLRAGRTRRASSSTSASTAAAPRPTTSSTYLSGRSLSYWAAREGMDVHDARWRVCGAEGDDHQRVRRLGRRR